MMYVYILESIEDTRRFYVGITGNLKLRLEEHNSGAVFHTAKYRPWRVKNYIAFDDPKKAYSFEQYLKSGSGRAFAKKALLSKKAPLRTNMVARIYKPARTAMQSGAAKTKDWMLEYEPEAARQVEPLMGWTASSDMKSQLRLRFASKEEAVGYCERRGIPYQLSEAKEPARRQIAYADNFGYKRRDQWTH